jgi:hypothetical protein
VPITVDPEKLERNSHRIYGCSLVEAIALNDGEQLRKKGSLAMLYSAQRTKALLRRIEWRLNFSEWLSVWKMSGLLDKRGKGRGFYCLARRGHVGSFSVENVMIFEHGENVRHRAHKLSPEHLHFDSPNS